MLRAFLITIGLILALSPVKAQDPTFADRKKSEWLEMLKSDENARRRKTAISALGQIANSYPDTMKEVLTGIGRSLKNDGAPGVRLQAAIVLGQFASKLLEKDAPLDPRIVVLDLSDNLRVEKEPDVRKEVAQSLGFFGKISAPAVQPLTAALKETDAPIRAAAAEALGRVGPDAKASTSAIILLLKDTEPTVRSAAIFALGRIEPDDTNQASVALLPLLKSEKDPDVRKLVVTSLCLLADKTPSTVQSVSQALFDENLEVRQRAAQSISKFAGALKLIEAELIKVIRSDMDRQVRSLAIRSIVEGFGPDSKTLLQLLIDRLKEDTDPEVRIVIAEELGGIAAANELTKSEKENLLIALREAQRDPSLKAREAAKEAMNKVNKPKPKN